MSVGFFSPFFSKRVDACTRLFLLVITVYGSIACAYADASSVEIDQPGSIRASAEFQKDPEVLSNRALISISFLLVVGLAAGAAMVYSKRNPGMLKGFQDPLHEIQVVAVKRVSPRLTLFTVALAQKKMVVLADNGTTLLQVAEWDLQAGGGPVNEQA